MKHWSFKYLGKKWLSGGRGPDVFDCWGLFKWVQEKEYNRIVEDFPISPYQLLKVSDAIEGAAAKGEWVELQVPRDGCAVALSQGRRFHHVGVYIDADGGKILHALDRQNVISTSVLRLKAGGWNRVAYYWNIKWPV